MMKGHARYDYAPITRRPNFSWPDGRRLAVYVALNVEHYHFGEGETEELVPGGPQPDVLNYAWRDYGNRVGAWRLKTLAEELGLPLTVLVNSAVYDYCPELIATFRARGDEIAAHGRTNSERQGGLSEADEATLIAEATGTIGRHESKPPEGWLGPWISESRRTPDLLREAGYRYVLDWCCDDQPLWLQTRAGPLLSIPYSQEINDSAAIVARRVGAREFADMIVDQYDQMRRQATEQPLVMAIALHTYIVGQPFRLVHLTRALAHVAQPSDSVWLARAGDIARHFAAACPPDRA
jgi:allantoinase